MHLSESRGMNGRLGQGADGTLVSVDVQNTSQYHAMVPPPAPLPLALRPVVFHCLTFEHRVVTGQHLKVKKKHHLTRGWSEDPGSILVPQVASEDAPFDRGLDCVGTTMTPMTRNIAVAHWEGGSLLSADWQKPHVLSPTEQPASRACWERYPPLNAMVGLGAPMKFSPRATWALRRGWPT